MRFGELLKDLRLRTGKSKYRLAQYSGLDQTYIDRLETGHRYNPSRDVVLMIALALVENSDVLGVNDVDELLFAAGYAPLRRRGDRAA